MLRPALVSFVLAAACSANSPAPGASRAADDRSACTWEWTRPETLFAQGASFGFGGFPPGPRLLPLGVGTGLVGDRMSLYADTETSSARFLGVSLDAKGNAALLAKPAFLGDVAGAEMWVVPASRGSVHVVWTTLAGGMTTRVVHATTDGVRWSAPDSGFSTPFGTLPGPRSVAAAGDDVIVALPTVDDKFSGVVVGMRVHGRWDVARFDVPHASAWELPLAAAMDGSGATIMYFHMPPSMGGLAGDSAVPGLYTRHRPWSGGTGGAWGSETRVLDRFGFAPVTARTDDGVFHVFWRGLLADSLVLNHAATHDFKSWQLDRTVLPSEVQYYDVAPEDANVRIVMVQTDDPNGMDMKYSRLLSGTWGPGGFSRFETVPVAQPAGSTVISRLARDTEALVWPGMRLAMQSTRHPGKGPAKWESYVPMTMLARHVRRCSAAR